MALAKARGKVPAAKPKSDAASSEASPAVAKLTVSIKRRLSNGDEVFIAPGVEIHCSSDDLDATQEAVSSRVNDWMQNLLAAYPDPVGDAEDDDAEEAADEDEDEAEDGDEDDDEEADGLTEDQINAMSKKELVALIKEDELDVDTSLALKNLRVAVIEALSEGDEDEDEDGEDEDEDADEDADEDEDEDGDEDEGEEDNEPYTSAELKAMKLADLQEITSGWNLPDPKLPKGADVATKKAAYIKAILKEQG